MRAVPLDVVKTKSLPLLGLSLVLLLGSVLATVKESQALPAFARKYNASCAMCHFPVYPRLNNFGQQFRRAGYRTPVEFGKPQGFADVGEYVAARARAQFAYEDVENEIAKSEFSVPEVALYYSGAVSRHFSAWIHATANNGGNVDFHGHITGVYGDPDRFLSLRVGLMHMLQQQGVGGFDVPTGLTIAPPNGTALTRTGTPVSFNFDQRQKGIELAYVHGPGRLLAQISNGLDETGSGTRGTGDIDQQKDYLVAYEHLLDDIASGITLFYYNGTTHAIASASSVDQRHGFWRAGVNANKVVPLFGLGFFEVQGGYTLSRDNNPSSSAVGRDVEGGAFYGELQQYLTGPEITFYERFSLIDPDLPRKDSTRRDYTVGAVGMMEMWLRLTGEYTLTENNETGRTDHTGVVELQVAF